MSPTATLTYLLQRAVYVVKHRVQRLEPASLTNLTNITILFLGDPLHIEALAPELV